MLTSQRAIYSPSYGPLVTSAVAGQLLHDSVSTGSARDSTRSLEATLTVLHAGRPVKAGKFPSGGKELGAEVRGRLSRRRQSAELSVGGP